MFPGSILDAAVCRFVPKLCHSPRKPQPVFIDTVGLFSPNEVCWLWSVWSCSSFSGSSVVFLLFQLGVKSNLLIPIQQQQQQLIWSQATWRPECQKFCCGAVGRLYLHVFFSRTWLTCWWFSFFYVSSLYLFLCQDTSSGEPQWRSSDVRVSAVLHQRWDHQVGSGLLICGLISEWFAFTLVDFTWVLLSHLSGWVVWTPAAVRT